MKNVFAWSLMIPFTLALALFPAVTSMPGQPDSAAQPARAKTDPGTGNMRIVLVGDAASSPVSPADRLAQRDETPGYSAPAANTYDDQYRRGRRRMGGKWQPNAAQSTTRTVLPESFGAKGDGVTDDTAAITAADAEGRRNNLPVEFGHKIYRATVLFPTTSWIGKEGAEPVIKHMSTGRFESFITIKRQKNLIFRNLVIDGNVSADPYAWDKASSNSFTGARGIYVNNSSYLSFENCVAQNCVMSGFSIYTGNNISYKNCSTRKNRGTFGDGFFASDANTISYVDCAAQDHTRIGFVADKVGKSPGCFNITYVRCKASYGHHASNQFGGTELNAGFWAENSSAVSWTDCAVSDEKDLGFVAVNGDSGGNFRTDNFRYTNCSVYSTSMEDCAFGPAMFFAASLSKTVPIRVVYDGCVAKGYRVGFKARAGTSTEDSFTYNNCSSEVNWISNAQNICYAWMQPITSTSRASFTYQNCRAAFSNAEETELSGKTSLSGHIAPLDVTPGHNKGNVIIDNCSTNGGESKPLYIKAGGHYKGLANLPNITIKNSSVFLAFFTVVQNLSISDSSIQGSKDGVGTTDANEISIVNTKIKGNITFGGSSTEIVNSRVYPTGSLAVVSPIFKHADKQRVVKLNKVRFDSDLSRNRSPLTVGSDNTAMDVALTNCTFTNSGMTAPSRPFVAVGNKVKIRYDKVYSDSSVPNFEGSAGGGGLRTPTNIMRMPMR